MKKLTTLFLSLCISIALFAQEGTGTIFEHGTLAEAIAKAAKNKKGPNLVFLDCYTTWCGPCKNMTEKVFPQEKVGAFFNANFVNIKIDMEKGEGPALAKKYGIRAFPTFVILDAKGNEVSRIVGGGDADTFIARVKKAMNPENTPAARLAAYDANPFFSNAFAYLETLQEAYLNAEQDDFMNKKFAGFQWYEKYSHRMWPFIKTSLSSYKSGIFEEVMMNYPKACEAFGKDKVDELLTQHLKQYIVAYVSGKAEGTTKQDLQKRVEVLRMVGSNDKVSQGLVAIAECVIKEDYAAIADTFNPYFMNTLAYNDRALIERAVLAVKEKLDSKILLNYYKSMAASAKKTAEDYAKLAETYKSDN